MDAESTNAQDARIEDLFTALDVEKKGYLDHSDLTKGLKKIDHPLKHAGSLITNVLETIDTNHDGKVSYEEFNQFVKRTESVLYNLFHAIDRNRDGKLEKSELRAAFRSAGLTVSNRKLDKFFSQVDANDDGEVSYEEWSQLYIQHGKEPDINFRDFLLFLPTTPNLENVLEYYTATSVTLSPEGDVHISDETLEGLGTLEYFLRLFFASLLLVNHRHHSPVYHQQSLPMRDALVEDDVYNGQAFKITAAEPLILSPIDLKNRESVKIELIACVPSIGYFAAGGLAGLISRTATAPLDRLKVYLIAHVDAQEARGLLRVGNIFTFTNSLVEATKDLWAAGGIRSLYAGNGLNIIKIMPENAIRFGFFEATKRLFARIEGHNNERKISLVSKIVAGGIGGMASQACVYPLDTLKFRMQCETVKGGSHGNKLIIETAKKMWAKNGIRAFYKGLPAGLLGIFPYSGIDMGTFEYLKTKITTHNVQKYGLHEEDAMPGSALTAICGAFSGALGASLVYPVNLVRTRLQSQGTILHPPTYDGFMDCARKTVKHEGVRGLFKGIAPNLIKVVPSVAITYVVYEKAKKNWNLR